MNLNSITHIYFIGIGGIGMSALARYFKTLGKEVAGYDRTATTLTSQLIAEGMDIHFEDNVQLIPPAFKNKNNNDKILVIYTPAIPKSHSELNYFNDNAFSVVKRSKVLGLIASANYTVAVAGTHGKTTTSSMIAHILHSSGVNIAAFLGGIAKNFNSNFVLPQKNNKIVNVVEADEFDRSFLTLFPNIAVISSMSADHLDIYGTHDELVRSYNTFAGQVKEHLILKNGLKVSNVKADITTYSLQSDADVHAKDITISNRSYKFNVMVGNHLIKDLVLGLPGRHNIENAVAAIAVAFKLNIPEEKIREALATYSGVNRRFDYQIKTESLVFIDDYAHHPEELSAAISSVKELYSDKKITGVFQPHLFTRTRDFADEFAQSLSLLDEVILLDIYPARELPIEGVTAEIIFKKINCANKIMLSKEKLVEYVENHIPEVLLTLGAGDIDTCVSPLRNMLVKKNLSTAN